MARNNLVNVLYIVRERILKGNDALPRHEAMTLMLNIYCSPVELGGGLGLLAVRRGNCRQRSTAIKLSWGERREKG